MNDEQKKDAESKLEELIQRFNGDLKAVDSCVEEIVLALWDVGEKKPLYWYYIQELINTKIS